MKKIFTSLLASAAVLCASAAVPTYEVNPKSGSTIENRAFNVTFTFSEAVTVNEVEFIGGSRFNSTISTGTITMTAPSTKVTVSVPDDVWGTPQSGEYLLTVNLPAIYDKNGNQIVITEESEEGETFSYAYTASANYTAPDDTPVSYVGVDPEPESMTAWDAYYDGWGAVNFMFTGEISFDPEESGAVVTYNLTQGRPISVEYPADDLWCDWNMWNGYYCVEVLLPYEATLTAENLASINIDLVGVMSGKTAIEIETVTYNKSIEAVANTIAKKSPATSGIEIVECANVFDVYNTQGIIIGKNLTKDAIKNLPRGIYIVDGKKISVR